MSSSETCLVSELYYSKLSTLLTDGTGPAICSEIIFFLFRASLVQWTVPACTGQWEARLVVPLGSQPQLCLRTWLHPPPISSPPATLKAVGFLLHFSITALNHPLRSQKPSKCLVLGRRNLPLTCCPHRTFQILRSLPYWLLSWLSWGSVRAAFWKIPPPNSAREWLSQNN